MSRPRNEWELFFIEQCGSKITLTFGHGDKRVEAKISCGDVIDIVRKAQPIAKSLAAQAAETARQLGV